MLGFPVFGIASGAPPPSDGVLDTSAQCFGAFDETNWLGERTFLDAGSDYGTREAESADYEPQRSPQTLLPRVAGTRACPVPSAVWILTATRFQRLRPCSTCSGGSTSSAATRWTSNQCRPSPRPALGISAGSGTIPYCAHSPAARPLSCLLSGGFERGAGDVARPAGPFPALAPHGAGVDGRQASAKGVSGRELPGLAPAPDSCPPVCPDRVSPAAQLHCAAARRQRHEGATAGCAEAILGYARYPRPGH